MHDLVIIGGGPAGLSAAAFALNKRLDVAVMAASIGGKAGNRQWLAHQNEREHLLGEGAFKALHAEVSAYPSCIVDDYVVAVGVDNDMLVVTTERSVLETTAVLLATGAQPTKLGIAHEEDLVGHGLGYSVGIHAHLLTGRDVAVVGASMRALRGAAELLGFARNVLIVAPEHEHLDSNLGRQLRSHPRVNILEGYRVIDVDAPGGSVHTLMLQRAGTTHRVPIDAIFVELGLVPNTHMVRQLVTLDNKGFVLIDAQHQTSQPGLFAAGDVTSALGEQILIAIGDGARAAQSAYDYILARRLAQKERTAAR